MELQRTDSYLKRCFVPNCNNNSTNSTKKFIKIPDEPELRKAWYEKVKIFKYTTSKEYCCEEHFDLKRDIHNYDDVITKFKMNSLIVKKTILPHLNLKFDDNANNGKKKQFNKYVDDCENHDRTHVINDMAVTYYDEYMNLDECFADSIEDLADQDENRSDILYSSDMSYFDETLNLKSISEIDMNTSKLYFPMKYRNYYY